MRGGIAGVLVLALMAAGCASKDAEAPQAAPPLQGMAGASALLAYEHEIALIHPGEAIAQRMTAVRDACLEQVHGACALIEYSESGASSPSGTLRLRVVPDGVEPLVALAGEGGSVGMRKTRAEDLADAVADNARQRELLEMNRARLLEFQGRRDLSVSDMLTIARELAAIESQLQDRGRDAAQHERRLQTNLLTLRFSTRPAERSGFGRIGQALGEAADAFVEGVSEAIWWVAFGLPFLVLLFVVALVWRTLWRRATRARQKE